MAKKYTVYEDGRVYSHVTNKFLVAVPNHKGYLMTSIGAVHRLVAEEFIPNPDILGYVDHIDNDKTNNHVNNLRWVTNQENCEKALAKEYKLKNRFTGEVVTVYNMNKWCRENGLHSSSMNRMLSGSRKYYNAWSKGE